MHWLPINDLAVVYRQFGGLVEQKVQKCAVGGINGQEIRSLVVALSPGVVGVRQSRVRRRQIVTVRTPFVPVRRTVYDNRKKYCTPVLNL